MHMKSMLCTRQKGWLKLTMAYKKVLAYKTDNKIMISRTKYFSFKAGLLPFMLIASQLSVYANADTGQTIVTSSPDNPGHLVKLRPFMANRRLPSRAQIAALRSQNAQMAETGQSQSMLSGQVAAFFNSDVPNRSWTPSTNTVHHSNRIAKSNQLIPAKAITTNSAVGEFCMPCVEQVKANNLPISEPPVAVKSENKNFSFLRMAEQNLSSLLNRPSEATANNQISATSNPLVGEVFSSNQLLTLPSQTNEQMMNQPLSLSVSPVASTPAAASTETSAYGNAGPPPFPLCLLPAPALKQLIRSMAYGSASHASNAPRSYFGSWHNSAPSGLSSNTNSNLNSSVNSYVNRLPQGNFHSYLQLACLHRNTRYSAPWAVTNSHRRAIARKQAAKKSAIKLVSYPAYATQSASMFRIAQ